MTGGRLAVVATPIGNLADLSPRAARELGECDRVLAEDTRRTRALLAHLGIEGKRIERLDARRERASAARYVERMLLGERIALVSDAGTPAVSDPGAALVRRAAAAGITVTSLPGPCAVAAALGAAGLPADRYRFFGFLPRKGGARRDALAQVARTAETVVLFEAPARLASTLRDLARLTPLRAAVVARELSKAHEELVRGPLGELATAPRPDGWRGEITLVLGPHEPATASRDEADLDERIAALRGAGLGAKEVARQLSGATGLSARTLYRRVCARRSNEHGT